MSRSMTFIGVVLALALALPALAQETTETSTSAEAAARPSLEEILGAILLPRVAEDARREGVPEDDVRVVLDASRQRRIPVQETREILEQTTEAVKANGPIDDFGAFVQARLDEGLRGRALAEAIHAEHRAHGKGKGHGGGHDHPPGSMGAHDDHPGDPHGGPAEGEHGRGQDDPSAKAEKGKGKDQDKGKGKGEGGGS